MATSLAVRAGSFQGRQAIRERVDGFELTDGQLIERVAAGEQQAFDELHRRYARPVLGLALRRLGDRGRAEDAAQDAFAAVWRSARTYDPSRGTGAPWLYAVARNAITNEQRRAPIPVAELEDGPGRDPDPSDEAESAWTAWRVHRALEVLPEHERPVIELAYWSGLSQSEVAEKLGIPLGTVKTRTRSALARLADALEGELR
jgi:RNA polymerase sigma-70 factor (ECF subfamily)